jgi:predicted nucleic acid-binding protein
MSLVIVDTSVWIKAFSPHGKRVLNVERLNEVATCPPIIQEVLQGIRYDHHHSTIKQAFLAFPQLESPMNQDVFLLASDLYRSGRKRGLTIRSSVDCLIAAICIKHRTPIVHHDRDFDVLARFSDLKITKLD